MAEESENQKLPPTPSGESREGKKPRFRWRFWLAVAIILGLLVAIGKPTFVNRQRRDPINTCIANLSQIDGAVRQWALENKKQGTDAVTTTDVLAFLKRNVLPVCPDGGKYSVSTVSSVPTCSKSSLGHSF